MEFLMFDLDLSRPRPPRTLASSVLHCNAFATMQYCTSALLQEEHIFCDQCLTHHECAKLALPRCNVSFVGAVSNSQFGYINEAIKTFQRNLKNFNPGVCKHWIHNQDVFSWICIHSWTVTDGISQHT